MKVTIALEWLDEPALEVHQNADHLAVTAHAGLSAAQVQAACAHMDGHGDAVFAAWQAHVT